MTRGNQREIDRQRAANRHAHNRESEKKSGDFVQRKEADAKALADKIARKREAEAAAAEVAASGYTVAESASKGAGGAVKKKDGAKKK